MTLARNNSLILQEKKYASYLKNIATQYGTPVFIFWDEIFRQNCQKFKKEFIFSGRKTSYAYSYKTNNIKTICFIAHQEGFGAEVVSASELDMALELNKTGRNIFYNGPLKTKESLKKAIEIGVAIHIDSLSELSVVSALSKSIGKIARIALRLTPEIGQAFSPIWNKFGLSKAEGEVKQALKMISSSSELSLEGLHMHIGTNITDSKLYEDVVKTIMDTVALTRTILNYDIKYIDIGGGFSTYSEAIPMTVHPEEWVPISIAEVVRVVEKIIDKFDPERKLSVVAEPGRLLVESAMSLLTRIVSIKKRSGRMHIILDGGTNILPTSYYTKHPLSFPGNDTSPKRERADFHGPLCTQFDVIASEIATPGLTPGDLVLIHSTGAYTYTFSTQFVGPRPPVVLVPEQWENILLIRNKEPNNVLWKYDQLPADILYCDRH